MNTSLFRRAAPAADVDAVWREFLRGRGREARAALVAHYAPLVKLALRRLTVSLPASVDFDDLIGCGALGLAHAIEKYDPARGVPFEAFALLRIRGAIIDELRRYDCLPRAARGQVKAFERALAELEQGLGRAATEDEIVAALRIDRATLARMFQDLHAETVSLEDALDELCAPERDCPAAPLDAADLQRALALALEALPERERLLITLYYHEEFTMTEIGRMMGLSQPRASQIHAQAIRRVRAALADYLPGTATAVLRQAAPAP